jgi:hypothetical protein
MSMISTSRARNRSSCSGPFGFAFIAYPEIARFLLESYKTLQSKATENAYFRHKISMLRVVQGELLRLVAAIRPGQGNGRFPPLAKASQANDVLGPLRPVETTTMPRSSFPGPVTQDCRSIFGIECLRCGTKRT